MTKAARLILTPNQHFALPKPVKYALWASVPAPMLIYYFFLQEEQNTGNQTMLYTCLGVTLFFLVEAMILPKLFEKLRPKQNLLFYDDHMILNNGHGQNMTLPYHTVKNISSEQAAPYDDEFLKSDHNHINILIEFDLDALAEYRQYPADELLIVKNIANINDPLRRAQDLITPHQKR